MTEETSAVDTPEVHAPHTHHTGHRWVDFMLAMAALSVSLISLWIAVHHGKTMEKLVQANSMPNVEVDVTLDEIGTPTSAFTIKVMNSGVGPARIESIEVWDGDQVLADGRAVAKTLTGYNGGRSISLQWTAQGTQGKLLGAGQESSMLSFKFNGTPPSPDSLLEATQALQTRTCYCSVFDECFEADSRKNKGRPARVERCEVRAGAFNEDISTFMDMLYEQPKTSVSSSQDPPKS